MNLSCLCLDIGYVIEIFLEMLYNFPYEKNSYFEFGIFRVDLIVVFMSLVLVLFCFRINKMLSLGDVISVRKIYIFSRFWT